MRTLPFLRPRGATAACTSVTWLHLRTFQEMASVTQSSLCSVSVYLLVLHHKHLDAITSQTCVRVTHPDFVVFWLGLARMSCFFVFSPGACEGCSEIVV